MLQKIHIIIALIAALAVTILSLYQDVTFYIMSLRLVVIIPIFYIIGLFFRLYLTKLFAPPPEEVPIEEDEPSSEMEGSDDAGLESDEPEEDYN